MVHGNEAQLLSMIATLFPAFLVVFTIRGFFEALVAYWMGDDTAKRAGFLSINPLAHVDLVGVTTTMAIIFFLGMLFPGSTPRSLLFTLLIIMGVRWVYHIPIEERNFKFERLGTILTALSGSIGNFVLALWMMYFVAYFPFSSFSKPVVKTVFDISRTIIDFTLFFGVINLIPIPPFDGGRILRVVLPRAAQRFVDTLEEYSLFILMGLFVIPVISDLFFGVIGIGVAFVAKGLSLLVV